VFVDGRDGDDRDCDTKVGGFVVIIEGASFGAPGGLICVLSDGRDGDGRGCNIEVDVFVVSFD
jgi:hypothetical protein